MLKIIRDIRIVLSKQSNSNINFQKIAIVIQTIAIFDNKFSIANQMTIKIIDFKKNFKNWNRMFQSKFDFDSQIDCFIVSSNVWTNFLKFANNKNCAKFKNKSLVNENLLRNLFSLQIVIEEEIKISIQFDAQNAANNVIFDVNENENAENENNDDNKNIYTRTRARVQIECENDEKQNLETFNELIKEKMRREMQQKQTSTLDVQMFSMFTSNTTFSMLFTSNALFSTLLTSNTTMFSTSIIVSSNVVVKLLIFIIYSLKRAIATQNVDTSRKKKNKFTSFDQINEQMKTLIAKIEIFNDRQTTIKTTTKTMKIWLKRTMNIYKMRFKDESFLNNKLHMYDVFAMKFNVKIFVFMKKKNEQRV